jgi:hypothetical protein
LLASQSSVGLLWYFKKYHSHLCTHQKQREAKKVRSLVVIKQSAQNNLHTILPCGLASFGSSLLMSNSYVWLLTESSSETLIQKNAWELALAHLTWQGNVSSLNSCQFGLVIVINPPSLVGEELITLSGWGNWKTSCVKIVFALVFLCIFRSLPSHKNLTQISLCYLGDLTRCNFNFFPYDAQWVSPKVMIWWYFVCRVKLSK